MGWVGGLAFRVCGFGFRAVGFLPCFQGQQEGPLMGIPTLYRARKWVCISCIKVIYRRVFIEGPSFYPGIVGSAEALQKP